MPVTLRPYTRRDRDQVAYVWYLSWNGTGIHPDTQPSKSEYVERLAKEGWGWDVRVAIIDNDIVGFVAFQREDSWLRQLFVLPERQRGGIGRLLLELAKKEMPSGFWLRTDEANIAAQSFYEQNGLFCRGRAVHPIYGHQVIEYTWSKPI